MGKKKPKKLKVTAINGDDLARLVEIAEDPTLIQRALEEMYRPKPKPAPAAPAPAENTALGGGEIIGEVSLENATIDDDNDWVIIGSEAEESELSLSGGAGKTYHE
jgi:hypothetical protein